MTRRAVLRVLAVLAWLWIPAAMGADPGAGERSIEIYRAQQRTADELLPLARTALAGEGTVTLDAASNALLLVGPRARVDEALAVLRELDARRPSILIHFESRRRSELAQSGIEIDWNLAAGPLRVGTVVGPRVSPGARIRASGVTRSESGGFSAMVRVLDGEIGRIGSGMSVPIRSRHQIDHVEATRGILARPRLLGDGRVEVELAPDDGEVDLAGRTRFTSGATRVVVSPGETTAIGGLDRGADARGGGTSGAGSDSAREEQLWLLRVEVPGQ